MTWRQDHKDNHLQDQLLILPCAAELQGKHRMHQTRNEKKLNEQLKTQQNKHIFHLKNIKIYWILFNLKEITICSDTVKSKSVPQEVPEPSWGTPLEYITYKPDKPSTDVTNLNPQVGRHHYWCG